MKKLISSMYLTIFLAVIFLSGCAGVKFNATSDARNHRIHDQTIALIEVSTENHSQHVQEIQALKDSFRVAMTFEDKRGKTNFPTRQMWKVLDRWMNTDFITVWQAQGTIGTAAAPELQKRAEKLFDNIITLEDSKIKKTPNQ